MAKTLCALYSRTLATQARSLAKAEPDFAARHAVTLAFGWLVLSFILAAVSSVRAVVEGPFEAMSYMQGLGHASYAAFFYGFVCTAAIGACYAIVPRAVGAGLHNEVLGATAVLMWGITVLLGIGADLAGFGMNARELFDDPSPLSFHPIAQFALAALALIVAFNLVVTVLHRREKFLYPSVFFCVTAALIGAVSLALSAVVDRPTLLPDLHLPFAWAALTGALLLGFPLMAFVGAVLWMVPVISSRPLFSGQLARVSFFALLLGAAGSGLTLLTGTEGNETFAAIGTALSFIFVLATITLAVNVYKSSAADSGFAIGTPMRFIFAGTTALVGYAVLLTLYSIPSIGSVVGFPLTVWATLGFFGPTLFFGCAVLYYVYPLLCGRSWESQGRGSIHFWFTVIFVVGTFAATVMTASSISAVFASGGPDDPDAIRSLLSRFSWLANASVLIGLIGQIVFVRNARKTSQSGEPVRLYVVQPLVPDQPVVSG